MPEKFKMAKKKINIKKRFWVGKFGITGTVVGVAVANAVVVMRGFLLPSAMKNTEQIIGVTAETIKGEKGKEDKQYTKEEEYLIVSS